MGKCKTSQQIQPIIIFQIHMYHIVSRYPKFPQQVEISSNRAETRKEAPNSLPAAFLPVQRLLMPVGLIFELAAQ